MNRCSRFSLVAFLSVLLLTTFSVGQERFQDKHEKEDDPAAFARWFMRSRTPRNTKQSAAAMLQKATQQKLQLRDQHLRALQMARQSGASLKGASASSQVWTPLGPSPIVWNVPSTDPSQSWTGRITAVAVDQTDSTGNTVVVGGAYGGVWRTTNATAASASSIQWTSLTDDQATLSIGAIAYQPGSSSTIVVGTGEPNGALDSYYGMGLMVTNDTGAHWTLVQQTSDASPLVMSGKAISAIAFNSRPGSTNNVVAGVASPGFDGNDDGVRGAIYSSDAGATWHRATITDGATSLTGSSVMAAVYNPKENKFFIVVRWHGVFVSTDQGHTYTRLTTQPNPTLTSANCPSATNSGTCPVYRAAMTVRYVVPGTEGSSSTIDEMYIWLIGIDSTGNTTDLNLYQTKNGGTSWTQMSESGINAASGGDASGVQQAWYDVYLGAVPNGSGTDLYAGAINIYKCPVSSSNATCTTKPFVNLTHVYDGNCTTALYPFVHPDQHGFDYLGSNPKIVYFGNDGGMYRTLDETTLTTQACATTLNVFDDMNADLGSLAQFIWGSHKYNDATEMMGGTQDNGTMYIDGTLSVPGTNGWYEQLGGDGGYSAIDSNDNWFGTNTSVSIQECPGGWVGCTSWNDLIIDGFNGKSQTDGDSSYAAFYTPWILDPQDETKIIVGTCRIWRGPTSLPSSTTWPNNSIKNALSHKFNSTGDGTCGNLGSDANVAGIAAGGPKTTSGSKVIYAGTAASLGFFQNPSNGIGGGIFVTQNAGAPGTAPTSWTDITGSIDPFGYNINAVAMDPHDATGGTVVAGIQGFTGGSGKVWRSTNFGSAWTDISGNLPDVPVNDVLVDPDDGKTIYAATDIGVFVTTDESTWTEVGPNTVGAVGFLPNTTVFHIAMYENGTDKRLRAWTHGRGAWETVLAAAVPSGVTLDKSSLSFNGTTGVKTSAQSITLTNNGAAGVTLGVPALSGTDAADFTIDNATTTCGATLGASANCTVGVTFTAPAAGNFSASLGVTTSDATTPTLTVSLSGSAAPPTATDFTVASTTTTASVNAGGTATYTLNVDNISGESGDAFNPAVSLSCSGIPDKSSCNLSSSSVSSAGSVTVSVRTTAPSSAAPGSRRSSNGYLGGALAAALAFPGLAFLIPGAAPRRKRALMFLGMMMVVGVIMGMSACGGGGSSTPTPIPGTTPGTYTVKIVGTYGSTTHEQDFTLTVN